MNEKNPQQEFSIGPNEPVQQLLGDVPLTFIDGGVGVAVADGIVRLNLYQDRLTVNPADLTERPTTRVVVARLAMTQGTAAKLVEWLEKSVAFTGTAIQGTETEPGDDPDQ